MTRRQCPVIVATRSIVDALNRVALLGIAFLQIKPAGRRLQTLWQPATLQLWLRAASLESRKHMLIPRLSAKA